MAGMGVKKNPTVSKLCPWKFVCLELAAGGKFCQICLPFAKFAYSGRVWEVFNSDEGREYEGREWEWISNEGREFPPFPAFKAGNKKLCRDLVSTLRSGRNAFWWSDVYKLGFLYQIVDSFTLLEVDFSCFLGVWRAEMKFRVHFGYILMHFSLLNTLK